MDMPITTAVKRARRRTKRGSFMVRDAAPSPPGLPSGRIGEVATIAGSVQATDLYRLMAWLSPAYPIGAFSYSSGIEWAVEAGDIKDGETLWRWLEVILTQGGAFCDAVFFVHAHRAAGANDDRALREAAELAAAF